MNRAFAPQTAGLGKSKMGGEQSGNRIVEPCHAGHAIDWAQRGWTPMGELPETTVDCRYGFDPALAKQMGGGGEGGKVVGQRPRSLATGD